MNQATASAAIMDDCNARITRSRAKSLRPEPHIKKSLRPNENKSKRANSKKPAENKENIKSVCFQKKGRAALTEVTNVLCGRSSTVNSKASKAQDKSSHVEKKLKAPPSIPHEISENEVKQNIDIDESKEAEEVDELFSGWDGSLGSDVFDSKVKLQDPERLMKSKKALLIPCKGGETSGLRGLLVGQTSSEEMPLEKLLIKHPKHGAGSEMSKALPIVDIDSNLKDPLSCIQYAQDIYDVKHVLELNHRPSIDYMGKVQRDINPSMRAILIDWLVEVSDEFNAVPDTLYLTVNLIDRFLSGNYIEKQRLQLLGVSCMLIASKYEEMSAPRVKDLCLITDSAYEKDEVVKMERLVLEFLQYQLSVPTTKTFLRRFVLAAESSYEVYSFPLECLANYLAELTLLDFSFLKYLPSLIAASAVFLARWTLDQSAFPWDPTLEHYTRYKPQDLKAIATAMQHLQSNTSNCPLNAIRDKYKQQRFNCVANLSPRKPIQSLFGSSAAADSPEK